MEGVLSDNWSFSSYCSNKVKKNPENHKRFPGFTLNILLIKQPRLPSEQHLLEL